MQCVQGTAMQSIAVLFVFGVLLGGVLLAHGQPRAEPLDTRLLRGVYGSDSRVLRATMQAADASAFPVFYAAPVAAWGGAALLRDTGDFTDAYRLTVTAAATYGAVVGLKVLIQRPRPYRTVPGVTARKANYRAGGAEYGSFAMPSGHAALSFALASSWSLSHPRWYVIAPGAAWAASVALSRVWLGVHYPSDILVGALLGTGIGVGVHLLAPLITPGFWSQRHGPAQRRRCSNCASGCRRMGQEVIPTPHPKVRNWIWREGKCWRSTGEVSTQRKKPPRPMWTRGFWRSSGGGIRTRDLRVMRTHFSFHYRIGTIRSWSGLSLRPHRRSDGRALAVKSLHLLRLLPELGSGSPPPGGFPEFDKRSRLSFLGRSPLRNQAPSVAVIGGSWQPLTL